MSDESTPNIQVAPGVVEQIEKMLDNVAAVQNFTTQTFTARQGFFEKLILLNGATLTLLFTAIGGLSHASLGKDELARTSASLFIGCSLFILSIMLSLAHNQLNIATLINMSSSLLRTATHGRRVLLGLTFRGAGIASEFDGLTSEDPKAAEDLHRGSATEKMIRWIGVAAQAATIFGYVALVASLETVIRALVANAH